MNICRYIKYIHSYRIRYRIWYISCNTILNYINQYNIQPVPASFIIFINRKKTKTHHQIVFSLGHHNLTDLCVETLTSAGFRRVTSW